jgi:hypothetical protein
MTTRPCRAPPQTISDVGRIGGGHLPMPGEVSLAHHGMLFRDELREFRRHVLEALRQPLENGHTHIQSREFARLDGTGRAGNNGAGSDGALSRPAHEQNSKIEFCAILG